MMENVEKDDTNAPKYEVAQALPILLVFFLAILLKLLDFPLINLEILDVITIAIPLQRVDNQPFVYDDSYNVIREIEIDERFNPRMDNLGFYFKNDLRHLRTFMGHHNVKGPNFTYKIPTPGENTIADWLNRVNCKFTVLSRCYVSFIGAVSNGTHELRFKNYTAAEWLYELRPGVVVNQFHRVVVLGNSLNMYGHFGLDFLAPLMLVPRDYLLSSKILCSVRTAYKECYFALLDLLDRVVFGNSFTWVYADEVLVATHPRPHVAHFGPSLMRLSTLLKKAAKVDDIVPTQFVLFNRVFRRSIRNFEECTFAIMEERPDINWTIHLDNSSDVLTQARFYSTVKFIVTICGSNCFNFMFMHSSAVAVYVNSELFDYSVYLDAQCLGIRTVVFSDSRFDHSLGGYIKIERYVTAVKIGIHYMENKEWPDPAIYDAYIL